jgi:predicted phosphodiesterase
MRIQYMSDLHLEFLNEPPFIRKKSDVLCLCGDIGYPFSNIYRDFLISVNNTFEKVFLISGNHEYYNLGPNKGKSMDQINYQIESIILSNNLTNISFLNNSYEDYKGFRFTGTILWSHINNPYYLVNDFGQIDNMNIEFYNHLHAKSCKFIEDTISRSEIPIIMLTHHMPSYDLIEDVYKTSSYNKFNQCFASDCSKYFVHPVKIWIYGHTHKQKVSLFNNIKFVCNPGGYPEEGNNINIINLIEV